MHCILTGFDSFGGADVNPSELAVQRAGERLPISASGPSEPAITLTTLVLPTCCQLAWPALQEAVSQIPAGERFALVLSGLAEPYDAICLERFALNVRTYRIADNQGHQWDEDYIDSNGPEAIRTKSPLSEINRTLIAHGFRTAISNHAGSFICNETYYRALNQWRDNARCAGIVFAHLPWPSRYQEAAGLGPAVDVIEIYANALETVARELAISAGAKDHPVFARKSDLLT